ncbi:hypothetical protein [Robbsia andropogonis]|uniref:hypothetical protein n=1 Tax=Robbsia andropogonis TaxID=28092 RepID=UPI002A6A247C|nr:hypothetical protein [Robbsia andropogonis]
MDNQKNFLNEDWSYFSKAAIEAAECGNLSNAEPLLRQLHKMALVSSGVGEILAMYQANAVREDAYGERDSGDPMEPPVSRFTMSALMNVAEYACRSMTSDVESLAKWVDRHGVKVQK